MNGDSIPLRIVYTEPAEAELAEAYEWLLTFGLDVAEKWLDGLTKTLERESALLAAVSLRRPLAPNAPEGRELFLLLYRTSGRRGSPWHIAYDLLDEDDDGKTDTLRIVRIRHAVRGEQ
ncbi:MAG: type II toxin-antitoxin system RelE/ParE family toxin [Armatimonadota bacterium]|nr:type II toxin-antitoxin system RelE/ParE family toxin [Armatimonadota bacterium]